jgi:ribosomal protein S4
LNIIVHSKYSSKVYTNGSVNRSRASPCRHGSAERSSLSASQAGLGMSRRQARSTQTHFANKDLEQFRNEFSKIEGANHLSRVLGLVIFMKEFYVFLHNRVGVFMLSVKLSCSDV